jgi:hypothetical protein
LDRNLDSSKHRRARRSGISQGQLFARAVKAAAFLIDLLSRRYMKVQRQEENEKQDEGAECAPKLPSLL